MNIDLLIRGGRVIDPSRNFDAIGDVAIRNGMIVELPEGEITASRVINAKGCLVTPGLIDFHLHIAHRSSSLALNPDTFLLPNGVTSANDVGTTGTNNCEGFLLHTARPSPLTIKCFINILSNGVTEHCKVIDEVVQTGEEADRIGWLLERYPDEILGVKLWSRMGGRSLEDALDLTERLGVRLCIHASDSLRDYSEVLDLLRPNDIIIHFYQNRGTNLLDENTGKVRKAAWEAKKRGVIFDSANGRGNYALSVVRQAISEGFLPDVISSDNTHGLTAFTEYTYALPYVMSTYMACGMSLVDVLRCVTATPAREMGMDGKIGTLRPGSRADVTVLELDETPHMIKDFRGSEPVASKGLFMPMMTVKDGDIMHMRMDFAFLKNGISK